MVGIDEFVDSLYKGLNGSEEEVRDFKEEMKAHLVENYSSRIVYSNLDYSTATFNYKDSMYLIVIGGTLLVLWLTIRIYNKFNFRLLK